MTIEKGKPWGEPIVVPSQRVIASSDQELARYGKDELVSLSGGDLWKSLGSPPIAPLDATATLIHIDAIEIVINEIRTILAASSVEVGAIRRRGRYICASNSSFVKEKNFAPRAHPNDGVLDVMEINASMRWRQRWTASRRAVTGTHIPHPHIRTTRHREMEIRRLHSSEKLTVDGVNIPDWESLRITVLPDHWQVIV